MTSIPSYPPSTLRGADLDATALRAARGDREATVAVVAALWPLLRRQVTRYLNRYEWMRRVEEDLHAGAILAVLRYLPRYDGRKRATTYLVGNATWSINNTGSELAAEAASVRRHAWTHRRGSEAFNRAMLAPIRYLQMIAPGEDAAIDMPDRRCGPESAVDARLDLAPFLRRLSPRSREVVERRWGLAGRRPETLKEIGRVLRLSRERVRQLEERALAIMRGEWVAGKAGRPQKPKP